MYLGMYLLYLILDAANDSEPPQQSLTSVHEKSH